MTKIGKVVVGGRSSAKVMGVINVSPESFYKGSVRTTDKEIAARAKRMQRDGAHIIDVGAMSTAPYLETIITIEEEARRLEKAIKVVKNACSLPISADTPRAPVAEVAISAGADAINDVTGLKYDKKMARVVAKGRVPVIIGAFSRSSSTGKISGTLKALNESVAIARRAGVGDTNMIVDPSIGFFRDKAKGPFFTTIADMPWYARDLEVLSNLRRLAELAKPICVSVSRKSFLGHLLNLPDPQDRLVPSVACESIAVMNGACLVRTHSVRETVQTLTMLQLLMR